MNWWLWAGVAVFCTANVSLDVYLTHRGVRSRLARLEAFTDAVALLPGVVAVVLVQVLLGAASGWATAAFWGMGITQAVRLGRLRRHPQLLRGGRDEAEQGARL